jgi:hypothetical protein
MTWTAAASSTATGSDSSGPPARLVAPALRPSDGRAAVAVPVDAAIPLEYGRGPVAQLVRAADS